MKHTIFLFLCIASLLITRSIFGGYTFLDENQLIFANGGGFEVVEENNALIFQTLRYPSPMNQSKGILFSGSDGTATNNSILIDLSEKRIDDTECPGGCNDIFITDAPDQDKWDEKGEAIGDLIIDANQGDTDRKAMIVFGDPKKGIVGIGYRNSNSGFNLNAYSINTPNIELVPLRIGMEDSPVYVGQNKQQAPVLTFQPTYGSDNTARLSINTDLAIKDITVSGDFKVEGTLSVVKGVGVQENNGLTSPQSYTTETEITCQEFNVSFLRHINMIVGQISGKPSITATPVTVSLWLRLYYKDGNTFKIYNETSMKNETKREDETNYGTSLRTQYTDEFASNIKDVDNTLADTGSLTWKACLVLESTGGTFEVTDNEANQNHIIIYGLTSEAVSASSQSFSVSNVGGGTLPELDTSVDKKPYLQENLLMLRVDGSSEKYGAMVANGDFLIFSDGNEPIKLRADNIYAFKYIKMDVLSILNDKEGILFKMKYDDGTFTKKLQFINGISTLNPVKGYDASLSRTDILEHGISSTREDSSDKLHLEGGIAVGRTKAIEIKEQDDKAKLILNGNEHVGSDFFDNTNASLAFTGSYIGELGQMFWVKCGSSKEHHFPNDEDKLTVDCQDGYPTTLNKDYTYHDRWLWQGSVQQSTTVKMTIKENKTLASSDKWKFFVIGSLSTRIRSDGNNSTGTKLTIQSSVDNVKINNEQCNSTTCSSDQSIFDWPASYVRYTYKNIAILDNVPGGENGGDVVIKLKTAGEGTFSTTYYQPEISQNTSPHTETYQYNCFNFPFGGGSCCCQTGTRTIHTHYDSWNGENRTYERSIFNTAFKDDVDPQSMTDCQSSIEPANPQREDLYLNRTGDHHYQYPEPNQEANIPGYNAIRGGSGVDAGSNYKEDQAKCSDSGSIMIIALPQGS